VIVSPPYALEATSFRFPALAALAGRSALGGQREVALATYLAARLAHDVLPSRGLSSAVRGERANGAKTWLSTLALPAGVRPALARLVETSGSGPGPTAEALRAVIAATTTLLDGRSKAELDQLAAALEKGGL
jgi:hypothetical protein